MTFRSTLALQVKRTPNDCSRYYDIRADSQKRIGAKTVLILLLAPVSEASLGKFPRQPAPGEREAYPAGYTGV